VLNYISRTGSSKPEILDLGTGSGCIAIALKKNAPHAIVEGIDHSREALNFASENARLNHVDVTFRHGDMLGIESDRITGLFEIIVSNPPYIPISEKSTMHKNIVDFEPGSALFVPDSDPLMYYRSLANIASRHLKKPGYLIAEIHESFGAEILQMFRNAGFDGAEILKDINGKWRFVSVIHQ
jgi:release factor glutamine methyltransferase